MHTESAPAASSASAEKQPGRVRMPCQPYLPIENVQAARLSAVAASSMLRGRLPARADDEVPARAAHASALHAGLRHGGVHHHS